MRLTEVILAGDANGLTGDAMFWPFGVRVGRNNEASTIWCQVIVLGGSGGVELAELRCGDLHSAVLVWDEVDHAFALQAAESLASGAAGAVEEGGEFAEGWRVSVRMGVIAYRRDGDDLVEG